MSAVKPDAMSNVRDCRRKRVVEGMFWIAVSFALPLVLVGLFLLIWWVLYMHSSPGGVSQGGPANDPVESAKRLFAIFEWMVVPFCPLLMYAISRSVLAFVDIKRV